MSTVQDAGRHGWQSLGIGPGGAMDPDALRLGNILVGNEPHEAGLEVTLIGPVLRFEQEALIAVVGNGFAPSIADEQVPHGRAAWIGAGAELNIGTSSSGCRAWIAVAGGIDVPAVLGSRSTNLRAHFGGLDGRALRNGDPLPVGKPTRESERLAQHLRRSGAAWAADHTGYARNIHAGADLHGALRLIPGAEFPQLSEASRGALFAKAFRVSARSDRMGYRLEGAELTLLNRREMSSEGVAWGAVQLPPDGHPIVLLADRQTTGGYPVIGHIATADRSMLAQRKPGDEIRFSMTTLTEARRAHLAHEHDVALAVRALRSQRTPGPA